jgi:hypothetical protein
VARFAVVQIVVVGMKAVGALKCFFFPVGLKRSETLLAPSRLSDVLRFTIFTDEILAHGFWMQKIGCGFLIFGGKSFVRFRLS